MSTLAYVKAKPINLRNHPVFTERWLQDRIDEDPTILGLGDVAVIDRERRQPRAGRLDLLLADPDENRRYEVELQLGATDESHIIRTVEYWDIERRRYPGYEHVAIIIAEDITSRFLNVLSLFSGTIPLVAIQLDALEVGEQIVLSFARVLDFTSLRVDDESDTQLVRTDRSYWNERSTPEILKLADHFLGLVNEHVKTEFQLNYNKYYVGLTDGSRSRNFVHFRPKKKFVHVLAQVNDKEAWVERVEEAGMDGGVVNRFVRVMVTPKDAKEHAELLTELIKEAGALFESE